MKVILASASPRRAEILSIAGISAEIFPAEVDESPRPGEQVAALVLRLAEAKVRATILRLAQSSSVAGKPGEPTIFIGADTMVEVDGHSLGKPASAEHARAMLRRLSARRHRVVTGIAVVRMPGGDSKCEIETTDVYFAKLSEQEIERYVATGEPLDKAGAYAIQGQGGRFIERIEGCYFNVVGLPLARIYRVLKEMGWS